MDKQPVVTKIAFVVDENARRGEEIRFVSMKLDDRPWTPPIGWKTATDGEYWRRTFLLFARYYERMNALGPLSKWPHEDDVPVLIHPVDDDYDDWRFLAKYWFGKYGGIGKNPTPSNEPKTKQKRDERILQRALVKMFNSRGERDDSPWISVEADLHQNTILLCTAQRCKFPAGPKSRQIVPENRFDEDCLTDAMRVRSVFKELSERVAEFEREKARRSEEPSWISAYKDVLASLIPEYPLCLTLQPEETKINPLTGRASTVPSSPILPSVLILDPSLGPQRVLISGPSGAGKSTLLLQLANEYLQHSGKLSPDCLPVFVNLNFFNRHADCTFKELVLESIRELFGAARAILTDKLELQLKDWLDSDRSRGPGIVYLLDGYQDIVSERRFGPEGFGRLLATLLRNHQGHTIITTIGSECPSYFGPRVYLLQAPHDEEIEGYVEAKLGDTRYAPFAAQILHDRRYRSITKNPFCLYHLTELALQLAEKPETATASLPGSRSALLRAIVANVFDRKFHHENVERPKPLQAFPIIVSTLSRIAHDILENPTRRVTFPAGITPIVDDLGAQQSILRTAVLAGLLQPIDFDVTTDDQTVAFTHDLFRDYFAALWIRNRVSERTVEFASEYMENHRWDESLSLFAELCDNPQILGETLNDLAQHDFCLASELAVRTPGLASPEVLSLLRGHAYWLEIIHDMIGHRDACYGVTLEGVYPQISSRVVVELLSRLEGPQLLRLRRELPFACWLWSNTLAAIGMHGQELFNRAVRDSALDGPWQVALVLEGLWHVGSLDAFCQATDIVRSALVDYFEPDDATSPDLPFLGKCYDIFARWPASILPDKLLTMIHTEKHALTQAILFHALGRARFVERHIESLRCLATNSDDEDLVEMALTALGRVGGAAAVDAIMRFAEDRLLSQGDIRTGATLDRYLDIVLKALDATQEPYSATKRLAVLLGLHQRPAAVAGSRKRRRGNLDHHKAAWNRLLLDVMANATQEVNLVSHFAPEAADDETIRELQRIANTYSLFPACVEAIKALGRVHCRTIPEEVLKRMDQLVTRRHVSLPEIIDYVESFRTLDFLPLCGFHFLEDITRTIGFSASDDAIGVFRRLCENQSLPPSVRVHCALFLLQYGIRPSPEFVSSVLYWHSQMPDALHPQEVQLAALLAEMSDTDVADILSRLKRSASKFIERNDFGRPSAEGYFARRAMRLLAGREKRYFRDLDDWPTGLGSVPEEYRPAGFDELEKIVAEVPAH